MSERTTCLLCGFDGRADEVRVGLVQWAEPAAHLDRVWESVARCADRLGCRARLAAKDPPERWPLVDASWDTWDTAPSTSTLGPTPVVASDPEPDVSHETPATAAPQPVPVVRAAEPPEPPEWSDHLVDEEEEFQWP